MDKHLLSKDNSLIVRGLAILSIVFHNFLHFYRFGFAQENEFSFSVEKAVGFFSYLITAAALVYGTTYLRAHTSVSGGIFRTPYPPAIFSYW